MEKVKSGDRIEIRASTWNAFVDAANWAKGERQRRRGGGISNGLGPGIVLVRNSEPETRGRFTALVLDDIAVTPEANEDEFVSCAPVFVGVRPGEDNEGAPYAVLLEPVANGQVGRGMVLGVVRARVTVFDEDDEFAVPRTSGDGSFESSQSGVARILWREPGLGERWCLLQLGGAGGAGGEKAYLCRVVGGDTKNGYWVTVHPDGREDTSGVYDAVLYVPDLALESELPVGTWVVGHKCSLMTTGGSET